MLTSTISDQGQTKVPAAIRKALKARPGTVLEWALNGCMAEVVPLGKPKQRRGGRLDYKAYLKDLKKSPAVPDHLLTIRRSKET